MGCRAKNEKQESNQSA